MKCVIFLALVVIAAAQNRPGHDHGNPLHNLIHEEVMQLIQDNAGLTDADCVTKCDALFDLSAGHDEEMTDHLCFEECSHQVHLHHQGPMDPLPTRDMNGN